LHFVEIRIALVNRLAEEVKGFIPSLGSILVVVSRVLETLGIEGESQLISK